MNPINQATTESPNTVKDALTPNRPGTGTATGRRTTPRRRRRTPVENTDFAAFATFAARVIRAHGRRVAEGDVEGLAELLDPVHELDAAVTGLRELGYSWDEIASRLGTSRQATQQRWSTQG